MKRLLPWIGISAFLGVFFFYPLLRVLGLGLNLTAFGEDPGSTMRLVGRVLGFTVYQAGMSTLLTLLVGLPAAFLFARYTFRGKALLRAVTAIPFMLPTVVVAAGFNALLGPRGWVNVFVQEAFQLEQAPLAFIGTLGAILAAHVFYNTTIVIRLVGTALERSDPHLEQAARSLGARPVQVLRDVLVPHLRPAVLSASLLVFMFDFTSFGVILLLGGTRSATLEVEIYRQAMQLSNLPLSALLSFLQLACTLVFSIVYSRSITGPVSSAGTRVASAPARPARSLKERFFLAWMTGMLAVFFLLPLISLPVRSLTRLEADRGDRDRVEYGLTTDYYAELFVNRRASVFYVPPVEALANSLTYAAATAAFSLLLGFPAAMALARPGRLEHILDPFLMLPLGASAVTLGLGFVISFGKWLSSPFFVPVAHTLIALPFVIRTLQPALASIPPRLREAAAMLGASPRRVWMTIDWPVVSRATLAAGVFAFTVSLGEFGATSLVVRPEYPTLPVAIARFLNLPGGLNYGQAMAMASLLMLVCGTAILLLEKLRLPGTGEL